MLESKEERIGLRYFYIMVRARLAFSYSTKLISEERNYTEMEDIDVPGYMLEGLKEESTKRLFKVRLDEKLEERNYTNTAELPGVLKRTD